jgi:hypothetical protein
MEDKVSANGTRSIPKEAVNVWKFVIVENIVKEVVNSSPQCRYGPDVTW